MSFKDCIDSAVAAGKLSQKKAEEAAAAYDEAADELRAQGVNDESIDFQSAREALKQTTKLKANSFIEAGLGPRISIVEISFAIESIRPYTC